MCDLTYEVEYAKSGRSECKICKEKIDDGAVRLSFKTPSPFCDKVINQWHHEECFFKKNHLKSVSEIGKFNLLLHKDQERIKERIKNITDLILLQNIGNKADKRNLNENANFSTFLIEYAKSSNATCRHCDVKIVKNEIRISKSKYDPRYGDSLMWYHVQCFIDKREDLMFFANGKDIPGFDNLKPEDQKIISDQIKKVENDYIIKRLKRNSLNEISTEENEELTEKMLEQSKLFCSYRNDLSSLTKSELHELLRENNQDLPTNYAECIDRLADCMAFGAPKKCPECKQGQLVLDNFYYKCIDDVNNWIQCYYTTEEPDKEMFKIPKSLQNHQIFKKYKGAIVKRLFCRKPNTANNKDKTLEPTTQTKHIHPLKSLEFFIYGSNKTSKEDLKLRILKLGGRVVSKLTDTVAAVVTTKEELKKQLPMIQTIQSKDIEVIEESFFDLISAESRTVMESLKLINENNIANWGADVFRRIPKNVIDGENVPKSGNMYQSTTKPKFIIKNGKPIDPASGLEAVAHVYEDSIRSYSVLLSNVNVHDNKNSYYNLQLLEDDDKHRYWVYRSWGRIGTTIGGKKCESFASLDDAKEHFIKIYLDKTKQDEWVPSGEFTKKPRAYVPVDTSYSEIDQSCIQLDNDSNLPKSVQLLVIRIFDTEIMNKTLLELELDVNKMPLGKLSKQQINNAYTVLSDLLKEFDEGIKEPKIAEASNKFYSLVPHNFGINPPKLLNNTEIIKRKIEMLDSLLDIEIAYKLLHSLSDGLLSPIESHYLKLKTDIKPLHRSSPDFELISTYLKNTHAPTHNNFTLEIEEIFTIVREGEYERYEKFKGLHNKRLLWHGSRITNLVGIISQGLRIAPPEAPVTGYMFGKGLYFADIASKSANYCFANVSKSTGFILLCEVALGTMKECYKSCKVTQLPEGEHSVWGVGQTEPDPKQNRVLDDGTIVPLGTLIKKNVRSSLLYNEFIVYDVAQVNIKYLIQLKFNFK
ncbi:poly [ADP-ribose] polymerase-like [Battus philenor]|uniref:poly [ADP-ribose] polymerase-like n=1 Tax=Battus philenor TaxID=42288 RepID=UPI0035D0AF5F